MVSAATSTAKSAISQSTRPPLAGASGIRLSVVRLCCIIYPLNPSFLTSEQGKDWAQEWRRGGRKTRAGSKKMPAASEAAGSFSAQAGTGDTDPRHGLGQFR